MGRTCGATAILHVHRMAQQTAPTPLGANSSAEDFIRLSTPPWNGHSGNTTSGLLALTLSTVYRSLPCAAQHRLGPGVRVLGIGVNAIAPGLIFIDTMRPELSPVKVQCVMPLGRKGRERDEVAGHASHAVDLQVVCGADQLLAQAWRGSTAPHQGNRLPPHPATRRPH
jgi:hypothetical protein